MANSQHFQAIINDRDVSTDTNLNMVLLDFLRHEQQLTGSKEGCREGDCGACTVLVGELRDGALCYQAVNSCLMPLGDARGAHILTIEGINREDGLTPIQRAFVDEGGTQCGFCTPGFLMSLTGYCLTDDPCSIESALRSLDGNICRCTGHPPILTAVKRVVDLLNKPAALVGNTPLKKRIDQKFLPEYIADIADRLAVFSPPENGSLQSRANALTVSGGTDLYVQRAFTMQDENVRRIAGRRRKPPVWESDEGIHLSGTITVEEFGQSALIRDRFPVVEQLIPLFGSTPIRNRATLAGNIVNASPIGDLTSVLLAVDASLQLRGGTRGRTVCLRDFYLGYKQLDKAADEIIETITLPSGTGERLMNFEKVSRRRYLDIASVNSTLVAAIEDQRILAASLTFGGVAAIPLYLPYTSDFLSGRHADTDTIQRALALIQSEIAPISDARGSADYKRLLARQLFLSHLLVFFPRIISPKELAE